MEIAEGAAAAARLRMCKTKGSKERWCRSEGSAGDL